MELTGQNFIGSTLSGNGSIKFRAINPVTGTDLHPVATPSGDASAGGAYPTTAWSAMPSARSMISKPSANWSAVMHSGGFVWIMWLATKV